MGTDWFEWTLAINSPMATPNYAGEPCHWSLRNWEKSKIESDKESGVTKYKVMHFCLLTPGLNIILILILANYIVKNYFYSEIKKIAFNL